MGNLSKNERLHQLQKENEKLRKRLSEITGDDPVGDADATGAPDVTDMSVKDIKAAVDEIDDVNVLAVMLDAERKGDDRKTASEAISARIDALQSPAADDDGENPD